MTTKLEQAARQALDALEELFHSNSTKVAVEKYNTAHTSLREALAEQAEQEPVAKVIGGVFEPCNDDVLSGAWELYAAPVSTKDLTDVDLWNLWEKSDSNIEFARAVIAADREKNK